MALFHVKEECTYLYAFSIQLDFYGDAGLRKLLFESDVFSLGIAQQTLVGKCFDGRSMHSNL